MKWWQIIIWIPYLSLLLGVLIHGYWKRNKNRRDSRPDQGAQGSSTLAQVALQGARRTYSSLEVTHQEEPITAWKAAWVKLEDDGRVTICGIVHKLGYGVEATAICSGTQFRRFPLPPIPHLAPHPYCTCGLYAVKTKDEAYAYLNLLDTYPATVPDEGYLPAILEVELYGKVIEGETGYRAEKLRVMKVYAKVYKDKITCCWRGGETTLGFFRPQACQNLAVIEITTYGGSSIPLCYKHYESSLVQQPDRTPKEIPNAETDWEWI